MKEMISGLKVLMKCESDKKEDEWLKEIKKEIKDINYGYDVSKKNVEEKKNKKKLSSK
jgi:hypothetical protein